MSNTIRIGHLTFQGDQCSEPKFFRGNPSKDGRAIAEAINVLVGKLLIENRTPGTVSHGEMMAIAEYAIDRQYGMGDMPNNSTMIDNNAIMRRAVATTRLLLQSPEGHKQYMGEAVKAASLSQEVSRDLSTDGAW